MAQTVPHKKKMAANHTRPLSLPRKIIHRLQRVFTCSLPFVAMAPFACGALGFGYWPWEHPVGLIGFVFGGFMAILMLFLLEIQPRRAKASRARTGKFLKVDEEGVFVPSGQHAAKLEVMLPWREIQYVFAPSPFHRHATVIITRERAHTIQNLSSDQSPEFGPAPNMAAMHPTQVAFLTNWRAEWLRRNRSRLDNGEEVTVMQATGHLAPENIPMSRFLPLTYRRGVWQNMHLNEVKRIRYKAGGHFTLIAGDGRKVAFNSRCVSDAPMIWADIVGEWDRQGIQPKLINGAIAGMLGQLLFLGAITFGICWLFLWPAIVGWCEDRKIESGETVTATIVENLEGDQQTPFRQFRLRYAGKDGEEKFYTVKAPITYRSKQVYETVPLYLGHEPESYTHIPGTWINALFFVGWLGLMMIAFIFMLMTLEALGWWTDRIEGRPWKWPPLYRLPPGYQPKGDRTVTSTAAGP